MNELIIEQGRTERQYWRDLWRYRELFYFLAARPAGSVQTNRGRDRVVINPPVPYHGGAHGRFRQVRENALGRSALPAVGFLRNAAVAVFFHGAVRKWEQPREQLEPDFQGLFPAPDRARQQRHHQLRGFPDLRRLSRRVDGLVPLSPISQLPSPSVICAPGLRRLVRCRALDRR